MAEAMQTKVLTQDEEARGQDGASTTIVPTILGCM